RHLFLRHDSILVSKVWSLRHFQGDSQVKTDKASGIVNDPNEWCDELDDPTYIIDLIKKVTTVSVGTVKIVEGLSLA
ncbi:hypothetical protein PJH10_27725, partial [Mycobacterium kansasii]